MKYLPIALVLILLATSVCAEEEGGEHKAPPPKPSKDSPVIQVVKLPVVMAWQKWVSSYKGSSLNVWGESLNIVEGQKCWGVAVGETLPGPGGKIHVWRRFCVPQGGGEIWVENTQATPDADIKYMPYEKWVEQCAPTEKSEGSC